MKRFITIAVVSLVMASCSTSVAAVERLATASALQVKMDNTSKVQAFLDMTAGVKVDKTLLEQQHSNAILEMQRKEAYEAQLRSNTNNLERTLDKLKQHINKTWYVFSGSTPSGWDCSGLVMWTFSHLGIELEHSATAQMRSGEKTKTPKAGDVVAFLYTGQSTAYHVGIFIEPDVMLHSGGKRGDVTELQSISKFAGNYSDVVYIEIIKTK